MANSREAQLKWDITKAMTARGWKAGTAGGYVHKDEYVSELELPHYRLTKREKQSLSEIIDRLSDLYGAEVRDDYKLLFVNGIADRIERDSAMMAQMCNHSEDQVMHDLFLKKVTGHPTRRPEGPQEAQHTAVGGRGNGYVVCVAEFEAVGEERES